MKSLRINSFTEYQEQYTKSIDNPEQFWSDIAETFLWKKKWNKVLDWNFDEPNVKWFEGAKLNITENCLDRHLPEKENDVAYRWVQNDTKDETISITYGELAKDVNKLANGLKSLGVKKGDRVVIYLPMIPEILHAVLACARIGAIHSVVFAGFSANALSDRINDAKAKVVLTSNLQKRGAKSIDLNEIVDKALLKSTCVEHVVNLNYANKTVQNKKTYLDWTELVEKQGTICEAEVMNAEDPLFILYTSGSTGKPKGVVHTCAGYMLYTAYSFQNVFQYEKGDTFWCSADIGWITGHSYIIYGPLLSGAKSLMFEGVPTYPTPDRFWELCEKEKVNQFYTAPTAIRALMCFDDIYVTKHNLSALKVLGTVGEPINDEAWHWYNEVVGKKKCAIVDTWFQTETGGIMLSGLGSHSPQKPTFAGYPLPGILPVLLDETGNELLEANTEGYFAIKFPWPSMIRTTYGDHKRCKDTYFSQYKGYYFTGDGAKRDENGMYRIIGRVDDVINVSGHRFGTAEIENAINATNGVAESAVVGFPHPIKGQAIFAYVICEEGIEKEDEIKKNIVQQIISDIGSIAKPEEVLIVADLPKTRSGKIMRRILRKIAAKEIESLGDVSTLFDSSVVEAIIKKRL